MAGQQINLISSKRTDFFLALFFLVHSVVTLLVWTFLFSNLDGPYVAITSFVPNYYGVCCTTILIHNMNDWETHTIEYKCLIFVIPFLLSSLRSPRLLFVPLCFPRFLLAPIRSYQLLSAPFSSFQLLSVPLGFFLFFLPPATLPLSTRDMRILSKTQQSISVGDDVCSFICSRVHFSFYLSPRKWYIRVAQLLHVCIEL